MLLGHLQKVVNCECFTYFRIYFGPGPGLARGSKREIEKVHMHFASLGKNTLNLWLNDHLTWRYLSGKKSSQLILFSKKLRGFFLISKSFEWNSECFLPLNLFDSKSIEWIWELRGTFSHSFISKSIIPLVRDLECSFPDLIYVYI